MRGAALCAAYRPRGTLQIYYASRTHSQLSQFLNEVKRTVFAGTITAVALGARKGCGSARCREGYKRRLALTLALAGCV
jgi:hypothetical protein